MKNGDKRGYAIDSGVVIMSLLVLGFLIWEAWQYIGIMKRVAEWQFGSIDIYFPLMSVMALLMLALLPVAVALLAYWLARRRRRKHGEIALTENQQLERLITRNTLMIRATRVVMIASFIVTLFCCIRTWMPPSPTGPVTNVDATSARVPPEGPARLFGRVDAKHVAQLVQRVLIADRTLYIAPVPGQPGTPIRYFAEVVPLGADLEQIDSPMTGQLSRGAFPHETAALYEGIGVRIEAVPFILYRSETSLNWYYLATASQFAIIGLLALFFAEAFRWRRKRLRERAVQIGAPQRLTHR